MKRFLKLISYTTFRPGCGYNSDREKLIAFDAIKKGDTLTIEFFELHIEQVAGDELKGNARWYADGLSLPIGPFTINPQKRSFGCNNMNVAYDMLMRLSVELIDKSDVECYIENLDGAYADVFPPATTSELERCNQLLHHQGLPALPEDYQAFLKLTNGLEFNGMSLFGLLEDNLLKQTLQFRTYYTYEPAIDSLLFIGRIDDDLYCFNAASQKYEVRDITGFEIWDDYPDFDSFFKLELAKWL